MDPTDTSKEVIACQFFGKKLTIHSIDIGRDKLPRVTYRKIIDDRCGASYASTVAHLEVEDDNTTEDEKDNDDESEETHHKPQPRHVVIDCGSPITTIQPGDTFSHILVTSHECKFEDKQQQQHEYQQNIRNNNNNGGSKFHSIQMGWETTNTDGGSLFAYQIPKCWKTQEWKRTVIATGFRVRGQLGNMINPGAPGFVYTFYAHRQEQRHPNHSPPTKQQPRRPWIGISGDCAEAAYILRPKMTSTNGSDTEVEATHYELLCEIACGATIGSLAIGYDNFCDVPQQKDFAKIYIPCYEKDKILVFALGDGTGP